MRKLLERTDTATLKEYFYDRYLRYPHGLTRKQIIELILKVS